jgi:hypothetical protein
MCVSYRFSKFICMELKSNLALQAQLRSARFPVLFVFICSWFMKSVSSWSYVVLNDWMIVNTELKRVLDW